MVFLSGEFFKTRDFALLRLNIQLISVLTNIFIFFKNKTIIFFL